MIGAKYTKAERMFLEEAVKKEGCYLDFDFSTGVYSIKYQPEAATHGKIIAKVSRRTIQQYYRPKRTLNYIARRAKKERGISVEMISNKGREVDGRELSE